MDGCASGADSHSPARPPDGVGNLNDSPVGCPDGKEIVRIMGNSSSDGPLLEADSMDKGDLRRMIGEIPVVDDEFENVSIQVLDDMTIFDFWGEKQVGCEQSPVPDSDDPKVSGLSRDREISWMNSCNSHWARGCVWMSP